MKMFALIFGVSGVAFLLVGYHTGLLEFPEVDEEETAATQAVEPNPNPVPAGPQFPDDLAPACRGVAVPQAAPYDPRSGRPHRLVFLFDNGKLRSDWQETLDDDWAAEKVEQT
jgi:hypothetical protein